MLYYISDRTQFQGPESARRDRLLQKIAEAARASVDYIQLREKDLSGRELECLAEEALRVLRENSPVDRYGQSHTRLLINSRADIALAVGADGVHLRADDISASIVHKLWTSRGAASTAGISPTIAVSCHTEAEVARAAEDGANLAVLGPVFEKHGLPSFPATGPETLRRACRYKIPVFALGGITLENIQACLNSGAAGIAAIRLFQENDVAEVMRRLTAQAS